MTAPSWTAVLFHAALCVFISQLKYREVYEKSKAQINIDPEAHEIRAAKQAYKNNSNVSVGRDVRTWNTSDH